jgi:REP element-mobilizing transposase RayT
VPAEIVQQWRAELNIYAGIHQSDPNAVELRRRIAKYEDRGSGHCWLAKPEVAELMQNALLHFDGERYKLLAWCVMPNHVHVMYEKMDYSLLKVAHTWKSFTAHSINRLLSRTGEVWEREGYDRFIRNETHFRNVQHYIEENPVAAGLVKTAADWRFSSAAFRKGQ